MARFSTHSIDHDPCHVVRTAVEADRADHGVGQRGGMLHHGRCDFGVANVKEQTGRIGQTLAFECDFVVELQRDAGDLTKNIAMQVGDPAMGLECVKAVDPFRSAHGQRAVRVVAAQLVEQGDPGIAVEMVVRLLEWGTGRERVEGFESV